MMLVHLALTRVTRMEVKMINKITLEYEANGCIARVICPGFPIFEVASQSNNYSSGQLVSSSLSNVPVEGGSEHE